MDSPKAQPKDGLAGFVCITFALMMLTFGMMAILQLPGPSLEAGASPSPIGLILFAIGGFSPTIAGFVMAGIVGGAAARRDLWRRSVQFAIGWRWYLVIVGLFAIAQGVQVLAVLASGEPLVRSWLLDQPVALLANLPALLLLGPVSEEYGWRGFAQDRMMARWSRPFTNLVLGLIWAFWHLPLFFIPGTSQSGLGRPLPSFVMFTIQVLALTVIYTWIYRKTRRSIWSAIFLHFMTAFAAFLAGSVIEDGGSFIAVSTVLTYVVVALVITFAEDLGPRGAGA